MTVPVGKARLAAVAECSASRPSGTRMKPIIAKKWAATQAFELIDAVAPLTVDSSCHGRIAGYARKTTPANASAIAPKRARVGDGVAMLLIVTPAGGALVGAVPAGIADMMSPVVVACVGRWVTADAGSRGTQK